MRRLIMDLSDIEDIVDDVVEYFDGSGHVIESYIMTNNFNDIDSMNFIERMETELNMILMFINFPLVGRDVTFYSTLYKKVIERRRENKLKELGI